MQSNRVHAELQSHKCSLCACPRRTREKHPHRHPAQAWTSLTLRTASLRREMGRRVCITQSYVHMKQLRLN